MTLPHAAACDSGWALAAAADKTRLSYAIAPAKVLAGATQAFTLTATNPETADPVTFTPGAQGDEILITVPAPPQVSGSGALTDTVNPDVVSQTDGFIFGPQPGGSNSFVVKPLLKTALAPGGRISLRFNAVLVDSTPGTASLAVQEFIGASDRKTTLAVEKEKPGISITAWFDRPIVGMGETALLRWQSQGGTVVTVTGLDSGTGEESFPAKGKTPPYPGQLSFIPGTAGSMPLTLTVRTSDGSKSATAAATLTVRAPYLARLAADPASGSALSADAAARLDWAILYARAATLTPPSAAGPALVPAVPLRPLTVTPGADALAGAPSLSQIPGEVDYLLVGTGFMPQVSGRVRYSINPVALAYLKYHQKDAGTGKLSAPGFALDPVEWQGYQEVITDVISFTLYQPGGGSETYVLGSKDTSHPQIQYFAPKAAAVGGKVTLEWVTANLASLTLEPGGHKIAAADIKSGSLEVDVPPDRSFTLTGAASSGATVPSALTLPSS